MSMYNKLFTKILDSSIWLEPTPTRIVWLTFIAVMDENGFCQFASVANVAHRARVTLPEAETAIACLDGTDPNSSDPDNEGRRLERVPGGWIVINAEKHRAMVTRAIIKEQTRQRVKRHRDKMKRTSNDDVTPSVSDSLAESTTESGNQKTSASRFSPPTVDQVREYCLERKNHIDPEQFVDHYTANGWRVGGKSPMKDWKACVRTWEKRDPLPRNGSGQDKPRKGQLARAADALREANERRISSSGSAGPVALAGPQAGKLSGG